MSSDEDGPWADTTERTIPEGEVDRGIPRTLQQRITEWAQAPNFLSPERIHTVLEREGHPSLATIRWVLDGAR